MTTNLNDGFNTRILIDTKGFHSFPKINDSMRIGRVTGDCVEHIINDKGQCTHIVIGHAAVLIDSEHGGQEHSAYTSIMGEFGEVECRHVPNKFCNEQFGDGSHCRCCALRPVVFGYSVLHESFFKNSAVDDGLTDEYADGEVYAHSNISDAWLDRPVFNVPQGMYYLVSIGYTVCKKGKANYGGDIIQAEDIVNISLLCALD